MTNVDLVALAASRGRISEAPTVDQVTAEVVRGAMETICFEMATYVSRTATTPILNQSNERNASILDAEGRLAALSVGIPQFMLASRGPVRWALEFFGKKGFQNGDTGGDTPGGYSVNAVDVWAEGLRVPAIKLVERGVERKDVLYLLRTNN